VLRHTIRNEACVPAHASARAHENCRLAVRKYLQQVTVFRTCGASPLRYSQGVLLADTQTIVSWRAKPRSFTALMGLYESNYIRLGWLAGDLCRLAGRHTSRVSGDCDLVLSVTERSPYTSTVILTYVLGEARGAQAYPDMRVRIYHDAHLVEAQQWCALQEGRLVKGLRPGAERELGQRWARNMMLNKWLEYCVERGHRFSDATEIRPDA
jgi:hypothetical protein